MVRRSKSLYAGHRFPAEVISHVVWLYHRFPLSLRMVEEMLAMRGITVSHETIRQWGLKFGREFAGRLRRRRPQAGDKWHLDEMAVKIAGRRKDSGAVKSGFVRLPAPPREGGMLGFPEPRKGATVPGEERGFVPYARA